MNFETNSYEALKVDRGTAYTGGTAKITTKFNTFGGLNGI